MGDIFGITSVKLNYITRFTKSKIIYVLDLNTNV